MSRTPGLHALSAATFVLFAIDPKAAIGASAESVPLSGHWVAGVTLPDSTRVELVVDLEWMATHWGGEFDVLELGVENYPVHVTLSSSVVRLHFAGPDADFEGTLSEDGERLTGSIAFGDSIPTELRRSGHSQLSDTFRALEAAAVDSTRVERLSTSGAELRRQFNADDHKARLLLLLSPT